MRCFIPCVTDQLAKMADHAKPPGVCDSVEQGSDFIKEATEDCLVPLIYRGKKVFVNQPKDDLQMCAFMRAFMQYVLQGFWLPVNWTPVLGGLPMSNPMGSLSQRADSICCL